MRAVVYCRISRDPTGRELGVKRQEKDCRDLVDREGWDIVEVFVDDDRSAYSGKPRPGYRQMCELLTDDGADVLVAWHPDRITRHPRELEDLIDLLDETSTAVRTVQTGEYDLSTPSGRMSARIVGAVARHESEHKSARLRRKHLELAEAGKVSGGGDRPFGYAADRITVDDDEAEIVRELAARVLAGESLRSITADLDARRIRTTAGKPWTPVSLRRVLMSPRIAGLRVHRGAIAGPAVWPAIITEEQHHRLVALLGDPDRTKNHGRPKKLLTGLLVCGQCGARMVSRPKQDRRPAYVCASGSPPGSLGCGKCSILGEPLHELVLAAVFEVVDSGRFADALAELDQDADATDVDAELADVLARLEELGEMWSRKELDSVSWASARKPLLARRKALEAEIRRQAGRTAVRDLPPVGKLRESWSTMTLGQQRAVLAEVVDTITIGAGRRGYNRFDPSRIDVAWRI